MSDPSRPTPRRAPRRLAAGLLVAALAGAALVAPDAAGAELWTPAPLYGADVRSLVFDPRAPDRAFAGSSAGHVYRSDDGGATWRDAGAAVPFPGWVVGTLVFDPERPERLWAGLWGIWGGGLVVFSDDLGASWQERRDGLLPEDQVYALAPVPGRRDRLFAGTRTGVWRSDDAGGTWRRISGVEPELVHVSSLLVDREDPERVLAGTWRRAFRSNDGGATWKGVFEGMILDTEVFSLHPVPGRRGELWASTCGWVYHASGLGDRWTRTKQGFAERRTPSFQVLSPERLLAGTVDGLHLSTDGGRSFRPVGPKRLPVLALAHHPARPERVLVGTEGAGVWLSEDGGETLAPRLEETRNVRVPALAVSGDTVYAALAHAGPLTGIWRSTDGRGPYEPEPAELPTVLALASAGGKLYAGTERGLHERVGLDWRPVVELGERRVDQLLAGEGHLVARSGGDLFLLLGDRFAPIALPGDPVRSAALALGSLWTLAPDALRRVTLDGGVETLPYAFAPGELSGGPLALFHAGPDGLLRTTDGLEWHRLSDEPTRLVPTGDPRFVAIARSERGLALVDAELGVLVPLEAPFPPADLTAARVAGNRLLAGSSAYGLWQRPLPE
ncbi:MAG: hypothetical protein H6511_02145 [Holophagales bacterium]|nr:hypothetical protein [Holophagales bacterium]